MAAQVVQRTEFRVNISPIRYFNLSLSALSALSVLVVLNAFDLEQF